MRELIRKYGIAGIALAFAAIPVSTAAQPGSILLPLGEQANWQVLKYTSLPPHRIRFSGAGLEMMVDRSAMPVIYPLAKPMQIKHVRVKGRVEGTLRVPPGRQGEEKFDDYVFRIGFVESGPRTLNFVQRQLAAPWVRKLFELAPKGAASRGFISSTSAWTKARSAGGGSIRSAT